MDAFSKVGLNSLQTPVLEGSQNRECLICLPVYTTSAWMATPVRRVAGFNQQLLSAVAWESNSPTSSDAQSAPMDLKKEYMVMVSMNRNNTLMKN